VRRAVVAAALLGVCVAPALAQADHVAVAVPFYRPAQAMAGLHKARSAPQATAFARSAGELAAAAREWCAAAPGAPIEALREPWRAAVAAWETLATPAIGPLLERRSQRQIDFTPTRPELIERAIARRPADAAAMERIGTPAKGLPALEWLLWTKPITPGTPACAYAGLVAGEVKAEADRLAAGFAALAEREWDEAAGDAALSELLNQWIGGVERLRWAQIDKPLREASATRRAAALPRGASAGTAASWARQWAALRSLAVFGSSAAAPQPGEGLVTIETYLRGRGLNTLADRWQQQVARSDRVMAGLRPGDTRRTTAAVQALARLKHLAEAEIAPALEITIGFSDADGD
jgi:uncharacterized protein